VPLGFLISSASIFIMRCIAGVLQQPTYEACLTDAAYGRIWTGTESSLPKDKKETLYAVATFDHELLAPGIHTWLVRRWNAFNVAAHSTVALLAAHAMAPYFHVPQSLRWWRWTAILVALLLYAAFKAWRETMAMLEFQTTRRNEAAKRGSGQDEHLIQLTHDSRSAISRAAFFLEKAKASAPESRVEFEAFLEAAIVFARAALHRFKSKHEKHRNWRRWWEDLLADPAVNFFRVERDWILKEASPKIGQKIFLPSIGPGGAPEGAYAPASAAEFYYFEDPQTPATLTVERHLDALVKTLADAEQRFT